jgi:hypothetical protein
MASGAPQPGGYKVTPPGGLRTVATGGISIGSGSGSWRNFNLHKNVDFIGNLVDSGARVNQTRGVANMRNDAKTTGITFAWTLPTRPGGSTATVNNASAAIANFTPDAAGTYVFRVVVTFTGSDAPNTITQDFTYVSA